MPHDERRALPMGLLNQRRVVLVVQDPRRRGSVAAGEAPQPILLDQGPDLQVRGKERGMDDGHPGPEDEVVDTRGDWM